MTEIIFEVRETDIPGLDDYFIDGVKVPRMRYIVEARRVFLEAAVGNTLRINVERAPQGEEETYQPSPPRLVSISSVSPDEDRKTTEGSNA